MSDTGSRGFTAEQLAQCNGVGDRPLYISVKGKVYDCTSAKEFYGPGKSYALFAGKEVTRCLAKMQISDEEANARWGNLSEDNQRTLEEWVQKYEQKYPVVGHFVPDVDFAIRGDHLEP